MLQDQHLIKLAELIEQLDIEELVFSTAEIGNILPSEVEISSIQTIRWQINHQIVIGETIENQLIFPLTQIIHKFTTFQTSNSLGSDVGMLSILDQLLTTNLLLERIQEQIYQQFRYVSHGQAKTIIKRFLGISLTQSERNDISKLIKKVEDSKKMVNAFEGLLYKGEVKMLMEERIDYTSPIDKVKILSTNNQNYLTFKCEDCDFSLKMPSDKPYLQPPLHHNKSMGVVPPNRVNINQLQDTLMELKQKIESIQLVSYQNLVYSDQDKKYDLSLYCPDCESFFDIPEDLKTKIKSSDTKLELPKHHGRELEIRIGEQITDSEKMERIKSIASSLPNLKTGIGLFKCDICDLIIEFETTTEYNPRHHNKEMMRITMYNPNSKKFSP